MKKFYLFSILVASSISACKEDDEVKPTIAGFSAMRNTQKINGRVEIYSIAKNDTLSILFERNMPNDEVLIVKVPFNGVGKYAIKSNQSYYYSTVGGDVFLSEYNQVMTDAGVLEVLKYDESTKTVTGKFSISLNKKWSYQETNVNTLNFTEGFFQGKINNYLAAL